MTTRLTLLLDLDNTLLGNSMDSFVPAYLQAVSRSSAFYVEPDVLIQHLLAGTSKMMHNQDPALRLEEVFDAHFYPALGIPKETLYPIFEAFYAQDFGKLRSGTQVRAEAAQLVQEARRRGYRLGIATNPLFPRTAIMQRLEWSQTSESGLPFDLVSSMETFHFTKPSPAYYAEFLAQMGWPEGPAVMVGDEPEMDIQGSRELGLAAFWTPVDPATPWTSDQPVPPKGGLLDVLDWLQNTPTEALLPHHETPTALLAILRSTPAALSTLVENAGPDRWATRPNPEAWSAVEIVCHLRDVDSEVNLPRLEKILQQSNPFISGSDSDPWAAERQYIRQDLQQARQSFLQTRKKVLDILEKLDPQDWDRPVRHAIFGPSTLCDLVKITAEHDRLHIRQLFQAFHSLI